MLVLKSVVILQAQELAGVFSGSIFVLDRAMLEHSSLRRMVLRAALQSMMTMAWSRKLMDTNANLCILVNILLVCFEKKKLIKINVQCVNE